MRVDCDNVDEVRIMLFFTKTPHYALILYLPSITTKFERGPLDRGLKVVVGLSYMSVTISNIMSLIIYRAAFVS